MRTRPVVLLALLALTACSSEVRVELDPATSPPPTPAASTIAAPAPTPTQTPEVTLSFTGDMLVHDDLRAQAARNAGGSGFDFAPMLAEVAPLLRRADWAVCHQETPISADNTALSGYPAFNAPRELATGMKAAGYDACSTASNHTVDKGLRGVTATLDTLDAAGIVHAGSARSAAEAATFTIWRVKGLPIGHLSYTYGTNGIPSPTPWAVDLIEPARIRADAAAVRRAGAKFVVVSLHFGTEKDQRPNAYQKDTVDSVLGSPDVDLVIGHHAHVVQPVERRADGRWVVFGLGNFLAQQALQPGEGVAPPHRDGVIVTATLRAGPGGRWVVDRMGYVPTFVQAPQDVVRLAPPASHARTTAVVESLGAPITDDTPG